MIDWDFVIECVKYFRKNQSGKRKKATETIKQLEKLRKLMFKSLDIPARMEIFENAYISGYQEGFKDGRSEGFTQGILHATKDMKKAGA